MFPFVFAIVYFEENFPNGKLLNKWTIQGEKSHLNYTECSASHVRLPRFCISSTNSQKPISLISHIVPEISKFPLFIFHTIHSSNISHKSLLTLSLSNEKSSPIISIKSLYDHGLISSLNINRSDLYHYEFFHEVDLSHSLALVIQSNLSTVFYCDGYPMFTFEPDNNFDYPKINIIIRRRRVLIKQFIKIVI